jgi:NAD(P)-dependent dehydrogenase (short-subunit alcohol dehydrogenase family)
VDPAGRSAIVTGGGGGLGSATARRLAEIGFGVVVFDRDEARATVLAGELGPSAAAVGGDVNDDTDVGAAIAAATDLGALGVLVNVAGGLVGGGPLVRDGIPHDRVAFERTMTSNATGTFNATRLVAAAMAASAPDDEGGRGVVVNTASIAGIEGQRGQLAYAAAKGAILGMTLPLARDLAPLGIRVCAIAPGPMGTEVMLRLRDRLDEDPATGIVFPPRMGHPGEFALLVEAIVRNDYLNGENVRLDGALRLAGG